MKVKQKGWLSPTERASVSAISLRHILASPWYAPGTIAVNVTWMKRGFNACQMHRSTYPSIFNRFPVIQSVSSKVRHFSTFWPTLGTPLGQSRLMLQGWKEDSMLVKSIAHILIYLQPFTSYREILVGNCNFFLPLAFNAPVGVFLIRLELREKFGQQKTRIMGLPGSGDSLTID